MTEIPKGPYPQNGLIEYVLTFDGYPPFFIGSQHILVSKAITLPGYQVPLTSCTIWWNNKCIHMLIKIILWESPFYNVNMQFVQLLTYIIHVYVNTHALPCLALPCLGWALLEHCLSLPFLALLVPIYIV